MKSLTIPEFKQAATSAGLFHTRAFPFVAWTASGEPILPVFKSQNGFSIARGGAGWIDRARTLERLAGVVHA